MSLDCYDFYLWSTGQKRISRRQEKEIFKEIKEMEGNKYE